MQSFTAEEKKSENKEQPAFNETKVITPEAIPPKTTKPNPDKPKAISTGDNIYTWIDKNGDRIYSDVPREGAELMEIKKGTDYTPPDITPNFSTMQPKVVTSVIAYNHFEIVSPANNATLRDNNGTIQVALDIRPKLFTGHNITLEIDGNKISKTGSQIITLNNIDRGTHSLVAHIFGTDGKPIISTQQVTIFLHRAIIRTPNN